MIVDSSAIIAILFGEPDAAFYANAIATASAAPQGVRMSVRVQGQVLLFACQRRAGSGLAFCLSVCR